MQMPAASRLYHLALNADAVCDSAEKKRRAKEKRGRREFSFLSRRATIVSEMLLRRERKVNWITAAAELRQLNSKTASAPLENGRLPYRVSRHAHLSMNLRERKFGLMISNRSMRRD